MIYYNNTQKFKDKYPYGCNLFGIDPVGLIGWAEGIVYTDAFVDPKSRIQESFQWWLPRARDFLIGGGWLEKTNG